MILKKNIQAQSEEQEIVQSVANPLSYTFA